MNARKRLWVVIACGSLVVAPASGVAGAEASVAVPGGRARRLLGAIAWGPNRPG